MDFEIEGKGEDNSYVKGRYGGGGRYDDRG